MTDYTIKVPAAEVVSPQDGNVVKFRQRFHDEHGNSVEPEQLSASRWANRIKAFFRSLRKENSDG